MRLSDFKDEKGIEAAMNLIGPIINIVSNEKNREAKSGTVIEFLSSMLKNSPKDTMELLAILNAEYHCNGASVLRNVLELSTDRELMALFGLRGQKTASSGSAQEGTEGQETQEPSAATSKQKHQEKAEPNNTDLT